LKNERLSSPQPASVGYSQVMIVTAVACLVHAANEKLEKGQKSSGKRASQPTTTS